MRKGKGKEVPSSEHHLLTPLSLQHRFFPHLHCLEGEERRLHLAEHIRHAMHLACSFLVLRGLLGRVLSYG